MSEGWDLYSIIKTIAKIFKSVFLIIHVDVPAMFQNKLPTFFELKDMYHNLVIGLNFDNRYNDYRSIPVVSKKKNKIKCKVSMYTNKKKGSIMLIIMFNSTKKSVGMNSIVKVMMIILWFSKDSFRIFVHFGGYSKMIYIFQLAFMHYLIWRYKTWWSLYSNY